MRRRKNVKYDLIEYHRLTHHGGSSLETAEYLDNLIKELRQRRQSLLDEDGNLKHTNCCDMTTIDLIADLVG